MPTVAETFALVAAVDTHADTHTVVLADARGVLLGERVLTADDAGHRGLLDWLRAQGAGRSLLVGIEGTGSYGARLAQVISSAGIVVVELEQPTRRARRGRGKSDRIDALLAVRALLGLDSARLPTPRTGRDREAVRLLLNQREELTATGKAALCTLIHLLRSGTDHEHALTTRTRTLSATVLRALAQAPLPGNDQLDSYAQVRADRVRELATRVLQSRAGLAANQHAITAIVRPLLPGLLDSYGIGPISAAQILLAYSHPGRIHSPAAFASLAGAAPLPASSGRTTRHRLNRGGDRQLNRALHTIAITRMRGEPRTRTYITRRASQKTTREIRRILKTYIAREVYKKIEHDLTHLT